MERRNAPTYRRISACRTAAHSRRTRLAGFPGGRGGRGARDGSGGRGGGAGGAPPAPPGNARALAATGVGTGGEPDASSGDVNRARCGRTVRNCASYTSLKRSNVSLSRTPRRRNSTSSVSTRASDWVWLIGRRRGQLALQSGQRVRCSAKIPPQNVQYRESWGGAASSSLTDLVRTAGDSRQNGRCDHSGHSSTTTAKQAPPGNRSFR